MRLPWRIAATAALVAAVTTAQASALAPVQARSLVLRPADVPNGATTVGPRLTGRAAAVAGIRDVVRSAAALAALRRSDHYQVGYHLADREIVSTAYVLSSRAEARLVFGALTRGLLRRAYDRRPAPRLGNEQWAATARRRPNALVVVRTRRTVWSVSLFRLQRGRGDLLPQVLALARSQRARVS